MGFIRIQLGAMDAMLARIITDLLAGEPDMDVVGQVADGDDALDRARAARADVLLIQDGHTANGALGAAFAAGSPAVLSIATNGREGRILRFDCRRRTLDAKGGLAAVLRQTADRSGASAADAVVQGGRHADDRV